MSAISRSWKRFFVSLLITVGTVFAVSYVSLPVDALESRHTLEQAKSLLPQVEAGQVIHYSYSIFERGPSLVLEPPDPYHRPYAEIWSSNKLQKTWIEVGADGAIARWRTQLFNNEGLLLQDLLFDEGTETGYFPLEGSAYSAPMEGAIYRDEQLTLIDTFLQNAEGTTRRTQSVEDELVISVYTSAVPLAAPEMDVKTALLHSVHPFIADLDPVTTANRIDFDAATLEPRGDGTVAWDKQGIEHVISYRELIEKTIVALDPPLRDELFVQEIPNTAFEQSQDLTHSIRTVTGFDEILKEVNYPLYRLDSDPPLQMTGASLAIPVPGYAPPQIRQGIWFAPSQGPGVHTVYATSDGAKIVSIVQGRTSEIKAVLKQTTADWTESVKTKVLLGQEEFDAWQMSPAEAERYYYVVEADSTILFIDVFGFSTDELMSFLHHAVKVEPKNESVQVFLPAIISR